MISDRTGHQGRLVQAYHALTALEALETDGFHTGIAVAVMNARAAYERLSEHQSDPDLTAAQAALIQTALELLRMKLHALGHGAAA